MRQIDFLIERVVGRVLERAEHQLSREVDALELQIRIERRERAIAGA